MQPLHANSVNISALKITNNYTYVGQYGIGTLLYSGNNSWSYGSGDVNSWRDALLLLTGSVSASGGSCGIDQTNGYITCKVTGTSITVQLRPSTPFSFKTVMNTTSYAGGNSSNYVYTYDGKGSSNKQSVAFGSSTNINTNLSIDGRKLYQLLYDNKPLNNSSAYNLQTGEYVSYGAEVPPLTEVGIMGTGFYNYSCDNQVKYCGGGIGVSLKQTQLTGQYELYIKADSPIQPTTTATITPVISFFARYNDLQGGDLGGAETFTSSVIRINIVAAKASYSISAISPPPAKYYLSQLQGNSSIPQGSAYLVVTPEKIYNDTSVTVSFSIVNSNQISNYNVVYACKGQDRSNCAKTNSYSWGWGLYYKNEQMIIGKSYSSTLHFTTGAHDAQRIPIDVKFQPQGYSSLPLPDPGAISGKTDIEVTLN
ncbi:hypothetical protein [Cysteiniphilum sp. JM-1]|uniref:hypothetical protein n=1 Tax=Cysteiniphilum sp. JM-1 TaxID=2610891 RepID=UPI001245E23A|nr:hypothetical protein [Cysteiniphilum sp. JM-1]